MAELLDEEELTAAVRSALAADDALPSGGNMGWEKLAAIGVPGLTVPGRLGGLEQSAVQLAAVYLEMGRARSSAAILPTMIAIDILLATNTGRGDDLLREIAKGSVRFASPADPRVRSLSAACEGSDLLLDGTASNMIFTTGATHALLVADFEGADAWFSVALPLAVRAAEQPLWDQSRSMGAFRFDRTRIAADQHLLLAERRETLDDLIVSHFDLGIAGDSVGGARQIFELTLEYVQLRHQFGRAIGSFQAIKHRLADHYTMIEAADALYGHACVARAEGASDALEAASAAKLFCCETYRKVATDAIQLHGGIGFTWEHEAHRFLKRALLNEQLGEPPDARLARLGHEALGNGTTPAPESEMAREGRSS